MDLNGCANLHPKLQKTGAPDYNQLPGKKFVFRHETGPYVGFYEKDSGVVSRAPMYRLPNFITRHYGSTNIRHTSGKFQEKIRRKNQAGIQALRIKQKIRWTSFNYFLPFLLRYKIFCR
jgi:hypothetical protein